MWWSLSLVIFFGVVNGQGTAINVADVPQCARDCLSNSTSVVAATCASLNVACLCKSSDFVSTFYCCLSTQCKTAEQAVAITFNQQQCAAVNTTAPDFVGCSPLKSILNTAATKSSSTSLPISTNNGSSLVLSTIATELVITSSANRPTATYAGRALLTGSCTSPVFAFVPASNLPLLFPQIGCNPDRTGCCPFSATDDEFVTQCPQDYTTTASACCPRGYQIYSTDIGGLTPCYSPATATLIPATIPSVSGLAIINDKIFTRKFDLTQPTSNTLSAGAIAAISVVGSTLIAITAVVLWWIKQRKKAENQESEKDGTTFPAQEPVLPPQQDSSSPQELASPDPVGVRSPILRFWSMGSLSSPPAYEIEKPLPIARNSVPQELPGSFFMNEHHPAYSRSPSIAEVSIAESSPRTPMRSPPISAAGSPLVTPQRDENESRAISPDLGSPQGLSRIARRGADQNH